MLKSIWWIETTERCNLHCRFCYNSWRGEPASTHKDTFRPELLQTLKNIANKFPLAHFVLSGGDVSTRSDFESFVMQAADLAPTALVTNGETISAESLQRLHCAGINDIQFSLHSHKEATHRFLTGGGDLRKTLLTAINARRVGIQVSTVMVLTEKNIDDVYGVIYLASRLGITDVILNPVIQVGRAKRHEQSLGIKRPYKDLHIQLTQLQSEAKSLMVNLTLGSPFNKSQLNKLFGMPFDRSQVLKLVIDTDLNIKPCSSASMIFGRASKLAEKPEELMQHYLQFWAEPPALEGCACASLIRQYGILS